jgi:hypothetical protein
VIDSPVGSFVEAGAASPCRSPKDWVTKIAGEATAIVSATINIMVANHRVTRCLLSLIFVVVEWSGCLLFPVPKSTAVPITTAQDETGMWKTVEGTIS